MKTRQLTVTFEKRLTDGAYGSELASAQLVGELEPGEDLDDAAIELMAQARSFVEAQLNQSQSANVRRGLQPAPRPLEPARLMPALAAAATGEPELELEELPF